MPPLGLTRPGTVRFQRKKTELFAKGLERLSELMSGAVDVGFYSAEWQVERGSDLLVGTSLHMPKHDASPILGAQSCDRLFNGRAKFLGFELVEGAFLVVLQIQTARLDLRRRGCMWRAVHADRVDAAPSQVIDGDVVRNLEQPAREFELGAVSIDVIQDFDEGILRQVFGQLPVSHHAEDEGEHRPLVAAHQFAESELAPLLGKTNDVGIGESGQLVGIRHSVCWRQPGVRVHPEYSGEDDKKLVVRPHVDQRSHDDQSGLGDLGRQLARPHTSVDVSSMVSPLVPQTTIDDNAARNAARGEGKREYVQRMFSDIAPRYDLLNHVLSLNIDKAWRRRALRALAWTARPGGTYLDLCAGTLDVGATLTRQTGFDGFVVGADFAVPMLQHGVGKASRDVLAPVGADALALPFANGSLDGAIVAFGIRNVADLDVGLREVRRVLKPGARFVILEFSTPPIALVRYVYHAYFHNVLPFVGRIVSGHRSAYTYLPMSVSQFPTEAKLADHMTRAGFSAVTWERLTLGVAAIHVGIVA